MEVSFRLKICKNIFTNVIYSYYLRQKSSNKLINFKINAQIIGIILLIAFRKSIFDALYGYHLKVSITLLMEDKKD